MQRHNPAPSRIYRADPHVHGSAQWATKAHLNARGYDENGRIFLGYGLPEHNKARSFAISTSTTRHGTILAPTRGGKGISFVVPHCLDHQGSLVVLDIKDGENAPDHRALSKECAWTICLSPRPLGSRRP